MATTYQACVLLSPRTQGEDGGKFELQTRDLEALISSLSPQAVLIKTQAAGVCHSDLHYWHGYFQVGIVVGGTNQRSQEGYLNICSSTSALEWC